MKISMFLSYNGCNGAAYVANQSAVICSSYKFAANCIPMVCSLPDHEDKSGNYHTEAGCRIDLLSVPENRYDDVLYLWRRLQSILDIHCVYLTVDNASGNVYSGCICDWPHYQTQWRLIHRSHKLECNPGTEATPNNG